ncbi:dispanin subfamily A member 2b-like protein [Labeo rohita]|uniref:Dispanin subfamily A member 2b-like protein n=1 Tax=Labeo rohita TaxID=84645 RepID=A0A498LQG4_LABRO|nr:interferon-induced transmembrane protein 1 [Labeo rohita]RXN10331.1 dispanin subfamily A member 2b-like protein [Labeo rohita]
MQNYPAPGGNMMQDNSAYTVQPVVVSVPDQIVKDDIIFSTFNLHFCNPCCLGFGAFYNSIKARDSRLLGNLPMAHSYGATARRLNIAAVIVGSISLLILIIILSKSFSKVTSS